MSKKQIKYSPDEIPKKIQVSIKNLNENGDGVAYYKKLKITIQKVLPGEAVEIRYHKDRPRKDRIKLVRIVKESPYRIQPPCSYFEECGGCHLQHLDYKIQLDFKKNMINDLQISFPRLKRMDIAPVLEMPGPRHYRNKTQMPFKKINNMVKFGLFKKGTHKITPIETCLIENKDAIRALQIIRDWASIFHIEPYDETNHSGILRHAVIRKGQFTNQVMVIIVSTTPDLPQQKTLIQSLINEMPLLKSVILNIHNEENNVVLGEKNLLLWGTEFIEEKLGHLIFPIFPNTFFQANSIQILRLLQKMLKVAELDKNDRVADLFCGVGTIGLTVAGKVARVVGLDFNPDSIQAANQNALRNQIKNAHFFSGDLNKKFSHLFPQGFWPDVIFVDPPRKGLNASTIQEIAALKPEKIIYISCNPKTLLRDLQEFQDHHYSGNILLPFDFFPHTAHIESLVVLKREA